MSEKLPKFRVKRLDAYLESCSCRVGDVLQAYKSRVNMGRKSSGGWYCRRQCCTECDMLNIIVVDREDIGNEVEEIDEPVEDVQEDTTDYELENLVAFERLRKRVDDAKSNPTESVDEDKTPDPVEDVVNTPTHYRSHPSGVECITVTEHMTFNVGNALKYLWRNGLKKPEGELQEEFTPIDKQIQDLEKAVWYIHREIGRIQAQPKK